MKPFDLQAFPKVNKEKWNTVATKQLKGNDPDEQLNWQTEGIELLPYYDQSDLEGLEYLGNFFDEVNSFEWKLFEEIDVKKDKLANEQALESLQGGCNGVIFNLKNNVDQDVLFNDIMPDICDISIVDKEGYLHNTSFTKLSGFIHGKENGNVYHVPPQVSATDSLVQIIGNLENNRFIVRESYPDFFLEIATIRALRYLLSHLLNQTFDDVSIHTTVPLHQEKDFQWFLNATAGLASILGGTNSISFSTAQGPSRISRNVGNLIREESGIVSYSDQCRGSYFVESLTHHLIEACKSRLNS